MHIAVKVVADVEDLVTRQPEELLHEECIAPVEDAALFDRAEVRLEEPALLVDDLVQGIRSKCSMAPAR